MKGYGGIPLAAPEFALTERGFGIVRFPDFHDQRCSLQESSLASVDAVWLGVHTERMHLSREQVEMIIGWLQHWLTTGRVEHVTEQSSPAATAYVVGAFERQRERDR